MVIANCCISIVSQNILFCDPIYVLIKMSTRDSISKVSQKVDVEGGEDIDDEDDDWFVYYNKNHQN